MHIATEAVGTRSSWALRAAALGVLALLIGFVGLSAAAQNGPYDNDFLDGLYYPQDIFCLIGGDGETGVGLRDFNGIDRLSSIVTFGTRTPLEYEVRDDGRFRLFDDEIDWGFVGSIGLGGEVLAFSPQAARRDDLQIPEGYAGLRISTRDAGGYDDDDFEGSYSYHALLFNGDDWFNDFGAVDADGEGEMRLFREGVAALTFSYEVEGSGRVRIDGASPQHASLAAGGDVLFQVLDVGRNDDPKFHDGYEGLAIYVRRQAPDKAVTNAWLRGTYQAHQLRIATPTTPIAATGTLTAGGAFTFFGSLGGADYADRLRVFPSGVFELPSQPLWTGTLGAGGDVVVVSARAGVPRLQIWLRTAGGGSLPGDRDGDGVRDTREPALGANPDRADTDGDGLLDNIDLRPAIADNLFTARLDEDEFSVTEGADELLETSLALDSDGFPYFDWSISDDADWLAIAPATGVGDKEVKIQIDPSELTSDESPWFATITITAPFMATVAPIEVRVDVAPPPVTLSLSPDNLSFTAVEGASPPAPQHVELSSTDATEFAWTAAVDAPWLILTPASGDGPGAIQVQVDTEELSAAASPYTATAAVSLSGSTAPAAVLSVALDLLPSRDPGGAWPVFPSSSSQSAAAVDADETHGNWVFAWVENSQIQSHVLTEDATPLYGPLPLSLAVQGAAAAPHVVVAPEGDAAWVIWQQSNAGTVSSIQARRWNLENGSLSTVFGIAGGRTGRSAPHAVFNTMRDELAVVYELAQEAGSAIELARLDAGTNATLDSRIVWQAGARLRSPRLAMGSAGYLLTATLRSENDTQSHLYARRLDPEGVAIGEPFRLDIQTAWADEAVPVYMAATDTWNVIWRERTAPDATAARYVSGTIASGESVLVERKDLASGPAEGHTQTYASTPEQTQATWTGGSAVPNIMRRRMTAGGFLLDTPLAYPQQDAPQLRPALGFSPSANEFLTIWQEVRNGRAQLYALREYAGSTDEDDDGLPNDWELRYGLDPFNPDGRHGADGDPDVDGLTNADEFRMNTDPNNVDTDGDGLWDRQEDRNRDGLQDPGETSPREQDTDEDGFRDDAEWFLGSAGDDPDSIPPSGLYRVDYPALEPGVPAQVTLHAVLNEEGRYSLHLNGGWNPPAAWPALAPGDQEWSRGVHVIEVEVTPPLHPAVSELQGNFKFQLTSPEAVGDSLQAILVLDPLVTTQFDPIPPQEIANRHAPIIKLHRDEFFHMTPIEVTLEQSRFDRGNTTFLPSRPDALDLHQSPQTQARVDIEGETIEEIREEYPAPEVLPPPRLYYSVAELLGPSESGAPPVGHVALQYYLHFTASDWGFGVRGGQRHEGDWQLVQILLDESHVPYRVTVTNHWQLAADGGATGGASLEWAAVERYEEHPVLYAGRGSHALHFYSGATRYSTGLDVHDGLGSWAVPWAAEPPILLSDYPNQRMQSLELLPRLSELSAPHWLRYAGQWGQDNFPQAPNDAATPSTRYGPRGPVFMQIPARTTSPWLDPYAWSALPPMPRVSGKVQGLLPASYAGRTVVAADARGQLFRAQVDTSGAFELQLALSHYQLLVVEQDSLQRETWIATVEYQDTDYRLLPVPPSGVDLGVLAEVEGRLLAASPFDRLDTDGDGVSDADDPDPDGDGLAADEDVLGDGFDDAYQLQDADGDLQPAYYDADDDGDGTPDEADEDANGDNIPDAEAPADHDGDGFIDAVDLDADNDGYANQAELAAGSDPLHFFDTPVLRLGDADGDGDTDAVDLQLLVNSALRIGPYQPRGDFNQDGRVDAGDIQRTTRLILESRPSE